MTDLKQRRLMGYLLIAASIGGALRVCTAHGLPTDKRWAVAVGAFMFLLAGLQLITAARGRVSAMMAGLVWGAASALGVYVAFGHETLSSKGDTWFLPASWNQAVGHAMFGIGAVMTAGMSVYFFIQAIKPSKK